MKYNLTYFFESIRSMLGGVESRYKANNHPAYEVKCPYCLKSGSVLGVGKDKESYLLLCPNCEKGYSLHSLIQDHGTDTLKEEWWKFRSGWIDYRELGYPIKHKNVGRHKCQSNALRSIRDKMNTANQMAWHSVLNEIGETNNNHPGNQCGHLEQE